MRLMLPALTAWAVCAATLPWEIGERVVAAVAMLVAALSALVAARILARGARDGWAHPVLGAVALGATACSLLLVASAAHEAVRRAGPVPALARDAASVDVEAVVLTDPRVLGSSRAGDPRVILRMRLTRVAGRGEAASVVSPVLVRAGPEWLPLRWHDRIRAHGRLRSVPTGDAVIASFRPIGPPRVLGRPGVVRAVAEHMRAGLRRAVSDLPADARGLLPGLVIGDTSLTPADLTDAMRATGMTHLSAVSGSNVSLVLTVTLGATALVGLPRRLRPWCALLVLAWFVVLARPDPSVIRAATMGGIGLIGMTRARQSAGMPVLAAAVLLLLVIDPWLSRSYGFALSTLATLGLLVFARPWGRAIGTRLPRRISGWGPALAIPVAAQVMCAPVIVLLQGSVSVIGVAANLVAAPMVAPATIAGVSAALAGLVSPWLAQLLAWLGAVPTIGIAQVARFFASVPGGTAPWPDGPAGALLLAALSVVAVLCARWLTAGVRRHLLPVLGAVVALTAALVPTDLLTWPPAGWALVVCDVGQGDAIVVPTRPHHAIVVDTGPAPDPVDRCLERLDVDIVDAVVLTHFHADHVLGLPGVLRGRTVRQILATPVEEPPGQAARVHRVAQQHGIPMATLVAGDTMHLGTVRAAVWWPARQIDAGSVPNNASVVLALHHGDLDALLLGDVEREAAHAMLLQLRRDPAMQEFVAEVDVVKTPHHGSSNLDEDFMAAVRAPVGIISVGADNDYGHPAPTHLDVLRRDGYAVYRTDQRGDVVVTDVEGQLRVLTRH